MNPRRTGLNQSERALSSIADKTFLRLWSYANVHVGKPRKDRIEPKKVADLLVICGMDVIIFSDKNIEWPTSGDVNIDWCRWFRRSIKSSGEQLRKAERILTNFPDSLYIDDKCKIRMPIDIPDLTKARVHGVLVASGAEDACRKFFNGGTGTLFISSLLKEEEHYTPGHRNYSPFLVGDVNTKGAFLHVFDFNALDLVMSELNTITDFCDYLTSREELLRSDRTVLAVGEEDLLACFLQTKTPDGKHDFLNDENPALRESEIAIIPEGCWLDYTRRPEYKAKKREEVNSYFWDWLIEKFTHHLLEGTAPVIRNVKPTTRSAEHALRVMAREPRVSRRALAQALTEGMQRASVRKAVRFCRYVFSSINENSAQLVYIFLILAYDESFAKCHGL